jgi:hypothetical protein
MKMNKKKKKKERKKERVSDCSNKDTRRVTLICPPQVVLVNEQHGPR